MKRKIPRLKSDVEAERFVAVGVESSSERECRPVLEYGFVQLR